MKVMLDSNIIISVIRYPNGKPYAALLKASQLPFGIVVCSQIVEEVKNILSMKFPDYLHLFDILLSGAFFKIVETPKADNGYGAEKLVRDETDRPILRAAIKADVDILITGDKDFLQSGIIKPRIMTAAEFLGEK